MFNTGEQRDALGILFKIFISHLNYAMTYLKASFQVHLYLNVNYFNKFVYLFLSKIFFIKDCHEVAFFLKENSIYYSI